MCVCVVPTAAMHNSFILLFHCIWKFEWSSDSTHAGPMLGQCWHASIVWTTNTLLNEATENKTRKHKKLKKKTNWLFHAVPKMFPFCSVAHAVRLDHKCVCSQNRCRRLCCSRRLLVPTPTVINLNSVVAVLWFDFSVSSCSPDSLEPQRKYISFVENYLLLHISVLFVRYSQVIVI